jgi:hypothetical protein
MSNRNSGSWISRAGRHLQGTRGFGAVSWNRAGSEDCVNRVVRDKIAKPRWLAAPAGAFESGCRAEWDPCKAPRNQ